MSIRSPLAVVAVVTVLTVGHGVAQSVAADDPPVAAPPLPRTPADNEMNHARRDTDRSTNDAGRAAGTDNSVADRPTGAVVGVARPTTDSTRGELRPPTAAVADADAVRQALAELAATAVMPDHLDRLTQRFTAGDRDRLRSRPGYNQNYGPGLDTAVRNLALAWQAKFGHPLTAGGAAAATTAPTVTVGPAPVGTPDRPTLRITLPAANGLPRIDLAWVHEDPDGYKADVPDSLDLDALRNNLTDELTAAVATKDQWPTGEAEAYRAITHRIVLALADQPLPPAR